MKIISRSEWGARYGRGSLDPGAEQRVVIHHSYKPALSPNAHPSQERAAVQGIELYHVRTNGWAGIGYNFLVAPSGRVYEGRGWQYKGAHAGPVNGTSIGICLLIDGTVTEPNEDMIHAVRELIREGLDLGELAEDYQVSGHRDHMARTCPGEKVYARLQEFRHDAAGAAVEPGTRVYSDYFGETLVVTHYVSDDNWSFLRQSELRQLGRRAAVPFSAMPGDRG